MFYDPIKLCESFSSYWSEGSLYTRTYWYSSTPAQGVYPSATPWDSGAPYIATPTAYPVPVKSDTVGFVSTLPDGSVTTIYGCTNCGDASNGGQGQLTADIGSTGGAQGSQGTNGGAQASLDANGGAQNSLDANNGPQGSLGTGVNGSAPASATGCVSAIS